MKKLFRTLGLIIGGLLITSTVYAVTVFMPFQGGTGTGTAPSSGQLLIGTSGGIYTPANLTAGSGISILNGSGAITLSTSGKALSSNSIDWDEIVNSMTLDANTSVASAGFNFDWTDTQLSFAGGRITTGGYLGIGTTNPAAQLTQLDTTPEHRLISSVDSNNSRITRSDTTGKAIRYNTAGRPGASYSVVFDGTNDYITAGTGSTLNFARADSFTLSAWIKTSVSAVQTILAKVKDTANKEGYMIYLNGSNLYMDINNDNPSGNFIRVRGASTINDGNWHHVVATYNGTSLASGVKLYLDGVLETMITDQDLLSAEITSSEPFTIGGRQSTQYINGKIDDARAYARAITAAEA